MPRDHLAGWAAKNIWVSNRYEALIFGVALIGPATANENNKENIEKQIPLHAVASVSVTPRQNLRIVQVWTLDRE
jgi:hypothetical protein